jgi:hypothetical protein
MDILLTILGVALPTFAAIFFHRRAAKAKAQAAYLKKVVARREKSAAAHTARVTVEAAAAVKAEEVKAAAKTETKTETEKVRVTRKSKGSAAAAMEHLRRLKIIILALALVGYTTGVRAEPCTEGISLMAGDSVDCDTECLPEPDLMKLVERSIALTELEKLVAADKLTTDAAYARSQGDLAQCQADLTATETDCVKQLQPDEWSPSTYILIGVAVFVGGVVVGALTYHELSR